MIGSMMRRAMIGDGSTLTLDFTTGVLDSRLTFTRASTVATYINSSGLIATASNNVARFDHDPTTLAPRGLLIEGAATNLLSYSEDFSNAAWQKSSTNGSMTLTGTAPDGTATSRLLEENTTVYAKHSLERTSAITISSNNVYTLSVWLKEPTSNSRRYAHIQLADGQATAARYTIVADLQTATISASGANNGTAGAPTGTAHSITAYPGGWYRVTLSMNHVASPSYPSIMLGDTATLFGGNNQPFYSATTPYKGLIVWGAQMEAGSGGASSYIPTGASQVTRNEDSATMSSVASLGFDQYQGTFIVRGLQTKHGISFARLLRIAGATTEPFGMPVNGVTFYGTSRNASNASIGEATRTNTLGQSFTFGMSLDANDAAAAMKVSLNGSGTSATRNALGPTEAAASFSFNTNATATNYGCFAVRSVKFFPTQKTLAQLNELTT